MVVTLGMIKKETNKYITKIHENSSLYEIQRNWTMQNCPSPYKKTINGTENVHPNEAVKT